MATGRDPSLFLRIGWFVLWILVFPALSIAAPSKKHARKDTSSPLIAILESKAIKKTSRLDTPKELHGTKWLPAGSNLRHIFTNKDGAELTFDWLKVETKSFIAGAFTDNSTLEYASITRKYTNMGMQIFQISVLIPHPKFTESAEALLLKPFADIDASNIEAASAEPLSLDGAEGTLFQLGAGGYQIVIPCNKSSFVVLFTDTNLKNDLVALAQALKLADYNRQIES